MNLQTVEQAAKDYRKARKSLWHYTDKEFEEAFVAGAVWKSQQADKPRKIIEVQTDTGNISTKTN